jgi:molybdenum cofactor cytidylyltransferase
MPSTAIVPAAGKAERFGGAKLLASVGGVAMLDRTLQCLLDGGVDQVVVVLPPAGCFDVVRFLADPRVLVVINPDPSRGMFSSIQVGIEAAHGNPMLVLPGDMPFVSADTVAAVLSAHASTGGIVVPRHDGRRGHPVALPDHMKSRALEAPPTGNLSAVLKASGAGRTEIDVSDAGILRDVDVRGDLS